MSKTLNLKQELFCRLYATKEEFFGNGVKCYIEAYKPSKMKRNWYQTAKSVASELLTKPNLCARISELLEEQGMNNEFIDKQLLFLITQYTDFNAKIRAIQEYNKIKGRVSEKKQITGKIIILDD